MVVDTLSKHHVLIKTLVFHLLGVESVMNYNLVEVFGRCTSGFSGDFFSNWVSIQGKPSLCVQSSNSRVTNTKSLR